MKRLYKFDCSGYYFEGLGIFWSTPEQIKKLVDKTINFGSIAGKHSEVEIEVTEEMFTDITDVINNPNFQAGLDPLYYVPKFDFIELTDGTKLAPEDLENENEDIQELGNEWYNTFHYDGVYYKIIGSKEEYGQLSFIAKEVENA